jgi:hypothetical protein
MLREGGVTRLEDRIGTRVSGVVIGAVVTLKSVGCSGNPTEIVFEDIGGRLDQKLVFRGDEYHLDRIDAQPRGGDGGCDGD